MHNVLTQVLLVLHVAAAAYWFGAAGGAPRRIRAALDIGGEAAKKLVPGLRKDGAFIGVAAVVVVATGLALVFGLGGFKTVHPRIHAALGLSILWLAVGFGLIRPNAEAIARGLEAGESAESLRPRAKRVGMGVGVSHLLFVVMLTLMLWRL